MLRLFLLFASVAHAQQATTTCSNSVVAQTAAVSGPMGASAELKVSSSDDASKNTHDCMAEYVLVVRAPNSSAPELVKLLASDGDWGRRLSLHLDGFSNDATRVFGILSEDGRFASTVLFEYRVKTGQVRLSDLRRAVTALAAAKCGMSLAVSGTTKGHAIVLMPNTTEICGPEFRWRLNGATGEVQRLTDARSVAKLYGEGAP